MYSAGRGGSGPPSPATATTTRASNPSFRQHFIVLCIFCIPIHSVPCSSPGLCVSWVSERRTTGTSTGVGEWCSCSCSYYSVPGEREWTRDSRISVEPRAAGGLAIKFATRPLLFLLLLRSRKDRPGSPFSILAGRTGRYIDKSYYPGRWSSAGRAVGGAGVGEGGGRQTPRSGIYSVSEGGHSGGGGSGGGARIKLTFN